MIDLSVVIISMDGAHFLKPCLESIYLAPAQARIEVLVIDNLSADNTQEVVSKFSDVIVIKNKERYSFARNNNIGILQSNGRYVLLLNADTEVFPGAFDTMVEFMDSHVDAGACGPKLLNPDGTLQWSCRYFPTPVSIISRGTVLRKIFPFKYWHSKYLMTDWDHNEVREIDWTLGAALMVRREVVSIVGMLDEGFRLYYEDIDWCYRIRQAGWKISYVPNAQIMHHYQRASAAKFSRKTLVHIQSILRYFEKRWFKDKHIDRGNILRQHE